MWNDELYFEYHRGVMTSQANHKRNMRESEEEMLNAEKWSSLAWLSGTPYPASQLNEAWKKVLFNQFHDLAAGSGISVIYQDAQKDYDMVRFTADAATGQASAAIAGYIDTQSGSKGAGILVFNPLAWERTDLVEFTVQLPAAAASIEVVDAGGKVLAVRELDRELRDPHLPRAGDGDGCSFAGLRDGLCAPGDGGQAFRGAGQRRRTYAWRTNFCGSRSTPKPDASPAW